MKQWSSAVPLLAIVFASGYMLGRHSPMYPLAGHHDPRAMSAEDALPAWRGALPDSRGQWVLPDAGRRDTRPQWSLPPGHPAIPDEALEAPAVDELDHDGIERDIVVRHPQEPLRT